jgi:FixJ family two-component response regulator
MTKQNLIVAVVENDAALLQALERLLRVSGYTPELYSSAEAFLDRYSDKEVRCLVLDINLDGISGIELQRTLAMAGNAPPIIFITGHDDDHDRRQALKMGCIAFLEKPFESRALLQAITNAMASD